MIKFLFGDEVRIPSCNHAVREVRRTCIALEDRTYHRDWTDRRHESDPDRGDIRDGGGENHGRARDPGATGVLVMAVVE